MKVGFGWDLHRLIEGRKLLIGGVEIPFHLGEEGHSDGDVLIHAVIDALLGPSGLGDIGMQFPPGDSTLEGISSLILLDRTRVLVKEKGLTVVNVDCAVLLEAPKLLPFHVRIIESLAAGLHVPIDAVSFKAKTMEGLGAIGAGKAVEAYAVVLVSERTE
jgi:2-C-methyl-D-erythritol 2,4-cyclodiphosphate synthase